MIGTLSLNTRLTLLVGVQLLAIAGTIGSTLWVTDAQNADGLVISLAGRQRMLTERFARETLQEANGRHEVVLAELRARVASTQITADRHYYTKNVFDRLAKDRKDIMASENYREMHAAIPLPATFVREVSESLRAAVGYDYELLSKWNINKTSGLREVYHQKAWESLTQDPDTPYVDLLPDGDGVGLSFATADVASAAACVSCHNQHPASPKKDFQLNDLMGILVVSVPITQDKSEADMILAAQDQDLRHPSAKTQKLFEETHAALLHGGKTFTDLSMTKPVTLPATSTPRIAQQLTEVEALWRSVTEAAFVIASKPTGTQAYVASLKALPVHAKNCLKEMDVACGMYLEDSESRVAMLRTIQYAAGIIALLTFIGLVTYIRLKVSRPLKDALSLAKAIEQAAEAVVITDVEGNIQYVNPAFEQVTGYTREETIGENPRILKSGQHDDAFYKEMWETLSRGEFWRGKLINKKKDGTLFTEEVVISPVRDASGRTVNYVAVRRDITHETQLEAQLRQSQKMEAVGQLAGGVAHDFNNLLFVIQGYTEMALKDVAADGPIHASLEEVRKASECAAILIEQLLAFSRRQVLDMEDVDLNDVIADLVRMLRRVIGEHITLDAIAGHDLGTVRADPGQIEQILMNLCVNARDAMPKGGTITIETENVLINDAFCEIHPWATPGRYACLSVADTGCGMDDETLAQVFEPFFTTKSVSEGTGLGLSTVYGLVKQHEGMIHVYSEVGQGTIFKVYLPLVERSAATVKDKSEGPATGGTETILLAEDDPSARKLSQTFLERAGYAVLTADDGEEALRMFEDCANEIDLLLLDVMMPKLGGRAVFERIREKRPEARVLFASGYSMSTIHASFIMDESLQLVQKPYQCDDLLRKVREVLDSSEEERKRSSPVTVLDRDTRA